MFVQTAWLLKDREVCLSGQEWLLFDPAILQGLGPLTTSANALAEAEWVFTSWSEFKRRSGVVMGLREVTPKCFMDDARDRHYDDWLV